MIERTIRQRKADVDNYDLLVEANEDGRQHWSARSHFLEGWKAGYAAGREERSNDGRQTVQELQQKYSVHKR